MSPRTDASPRTTSDALPVTAPRRRAARPGRHRRVAGVAAALAALVVLAGCGGSGRRLLVAQAEVTRTGTPLWAVEPGQDPGRDDLVAAGATQPLGIQHLTSEGTSQINQLGWDWQDRVLLSYAGATGARVTSGRPGERPSTLATATDRAQTAVLRRGVFVRTASGCTLADGAGQGRTVGRGTCVISEDERWVVSYRPSRRGITIRDLRSDDVRQVAVGPVEDASVLGRDARVLVATRESGGTAVRMLDATDGSLVARLGRFDAVSIQPPVTGARGFVVQAQRGDRVELRYVDTDGDTTVLDRSSALQPVTAGAVITWLDLGAGSPGRDVLQRWEPGGETERLLTGRLGAAALDQESVVALQERPGAVDFYREGPGGLERSVTLRTDTSQSVLVSRALVHGDEVLLLVASAGGSSLVRVDTHGEGSVPVRNWGSLVLQSVDHDGSVLLSGRRARQAAGAAPAGGEQLLVVPADGDGYEVRATVDQVGNGLLHDGRIYATVLSGRRVEVQSLRAEGDPEPEVLYQDRQVAGATWPENGGATETVLFNRTFLSRSAAGSAAPTP